MKFRWRQEELSGGGQGEVCRVGPGDGLIVGSVQKVGDQFRVMRREAIGIDESGRVVEGVVALDHAFWDRKRAVAHVEDAQSLARWSPAIAQAMWPDGLFGANTDVGYFDLVLAFRTARQRKVLDPMIQKAMFRLRVELENAIRYSRPDGWHDDQLWLDSVKVAHIDRRAAGWGLKAGWRFRILCSDGGDIESGYDYPTKPAARDAVFAYMANRDPNGRKVGRP